MAVSQSNIWEYPEVRAVVRQIIKKVDPDMLRIECSGESAITVECKEKLRVIDNKRVHNETLFSYLEQSGSQSFSTLLKILMEHLPQGQEMLYQELLEAKLSYLKSVTVSQSNSTLPHNVDNNAA
eukprot:scpid106038/ scgid2901/ 